MKDSFERVRNLMKDMERSLFFESDDDIFDIFTEKRMEIVREIFHGKPASIRELAEKLDRDIKNVHDDLGILSRHHIISFEVIGRKKRPLVKKDLIVINLR
jgi:predicted transcriptional regulator